MQPDTPYVCARYFAIPQPEWADRLYLWLRRREYSDEAAVTVVRWALARGTLDGCKAVDGEDAEAAAGMVPEREGVACG